MQKHANNPLMLVWRTQHFHSHEPCSLIKIHLINDHQKNRSCGLSALSNQLTNHMHTCRPQRLILDAFPQPSVNYGFRGKAKNLLTFSWFCFAFLRENEAKQTGTNQADMFQIPLFLHAGHRARGSRRSFDVKKKVVQFQERKYSLIQNGPCSSK